MHQKLLGCRAPDPLGELVTSYNAPSDPVGRFKGELNPENNMA